MTQFNFRQTQNKAKALAIAALPTLFLPSVTAADVEQPNYFTSFGQAEVAALIADPAKFIADKVKVVAHPFNSATVFAVAVMNQVAETLRAAGEVTEVVAVYVTKIGELTYAVKVITAEDYVIEQIIGAGELNAARVQIRTIVAEQAREEGRFSVAMILRKMSFGTGGHEAGQWAEYNTQQPRGHVVVNNREAGFWDIVRAAFAAPFSQRMGRLNLA